MREHFEHDFSFDGRFDPRFGMSRPPFPPFGCPDFSGHRGFGPFGRPGFDHSAERPHGHGPEHRRRGPPEDGNRGPRCCRDKSPESDGEEPSVRCDGPCGCRCGPGGRDRDFRGFGREFPGFGPWFGPGRHGCGRRGPFDFPGRPWGGPWEGPSRFDHPMNRFGRGGPSHPWCGRRRPCPYDRPEERPSRNERDNEPCCSGNKKIRGCDRGRKESGPCSSKDKDINGTGDTVFVQRIVLEKAARPQSV